jgi:SAM-dependent methyltransferase
MQSGGTTGMTPDEISLAGSEHRDPTYVAGYDRKAGFVPAEDIALLQRHGFNEDSILVDLGAGTGTFALAAAAECKRVVAVDISPPMVALIEQRTVERGIVNVECVEAGFLSYLHVGDSPDVLYTRHALHHLPDYWKAIALWRMAQTLRPGGILYVRDLVFSCELPRAEESIGAWLDSAGDDPEAGWTRAELEVHLRDEFSTFSWLLEPMIERAGLQIEWSRYSGPDVYAQYLCRKPAPQLSREML